MGGQYIGPFPLEVFYLIELLAVVFLVFVLFKRPIYEAMGIAFLFTIVMTGKYDIFWKALAYPATSSLFYAIFGFLALAHLFDVTKVIEQVISIIIATVGRFRGGAGYVSLIASTFMAALSGSGPGNVAATGVFTIPAMKRAGFPAALAATVEMSCSSLGNVIPPAGSILLAFGVLDAVFKGSISSSTFIVGSYAVGLWFVIQRWLTLLGFTYYYKVAPVPKEERPSASQALGQGWKALILPVLIFLPLFIDSQMGDFLKLRLGAAGAKAFSGSVLMFTPGVAAAYALWIGWKSMEGGPSLANLYERFKDAIEKTVPVAITIYLAYATAQVFAETEMKQVVQDWLVGMGLTHYTFAIVVPIIFMFLGMALPGTSQIAILGGAVIGAYAALGGNPVVLALLLPAMTGAMEGMTPPLALCMYTAMGISGSGFWETTKLVLWWILFHLLLSMILLVGLLPLFVV